MPSASLELPSHAKVNLWLRILGRREDGFHEVETRLVKVGVADTVSLMLADASDGIRLTCNVPGIPTDDSNLAIKALKAFEARAGVSRGWIVHLEKRIPHGAGLGGGSSNAAAVLKAANQLLDNSLSIEALLEIASSIGSDVPCFLLDTPAADGTGRGEKVVPVDFPWRLPLVLIKPPFPIPTPWAYKNWSSSKELSGVSYAPQLCPWGDMVNHLERPVFQKHLLLPTLKNWLLDHGSVRAALMSGSGSTLFAITGTDIEAAALAEEARHYCGDTFWVQATHTLSSQPS